MKLRFPLLVFALLLLTGSIAKADPAAPLVGSTNASLAAIFAAPAAPDCEKAADVANPTDAKLPSFAPAPTDKAVACGSCSDSFCQGKQFGQTCRVQGGKIYQCRPAYISCSPNDCQCWNGPLP